MTTISAVLLAKNEENNFLKACIKSLLKQTDEIIIVLDNRTTDNTVGLLQGFKDDRIRFFSYNWSSPRSYTSAKNYGLSKATKEWVLHIDADECLDDNVNLKQEIEKQPEADAFDLPSEHLLWNFGYRDATFNPHIHLLRLHKNLPEIRYPENTMHSLVQGWKKRSIVPKLCIWHFGYCRNMQAILDRYKQNMQTLEMHTPEYLQSWKQGHYFGTMPAQAIDPYRLPKAIREEFLV